MCGGRLSQVNVTGKLEAFNWAFSPASPYPRIEVRVRFMLAEDPADTVSDGATVREAALPVWVICRAGPLTDCRTVEVGPVRLRKFASPLYTG